MLFERGEVCVEKYIRIGLSGGKVDLRVIDERVGFWVIEGENEKEFID